MKLWQYKAEKILRKQFAGIEDWFSAVKLASRCFVKTEHSRYTWHLYEGKHFYFCFHMNRHALAGWTHLIIEVWDDRVDDFSDMIIEIPWVSANPYRTLEPRPER